ncbi:hypothetical protein D3C84_993170 [compost metagenome]
MQRVQVEFAQQVTTGNQRNSEQQQRDGQTQGLAVFADQVQQAQTFGLDRLCGSDGVLWIRRIGAHQSPLGLCATGWGYPVKLPIPLEKNSYKYTRLSPGSGDGTSPIVEDLVWDRRKL